VQLLVKTTLWPLTPILRVSRHKAVYRYVLTTRPYCIDIIYIILQNLIGLSNKKLIFWPHYFCLRMANDDCMVFMNMDQMARSQRNIEPPCWSFLHCTSWATLCCLRYCFTWRLPGFPAGWRTGFRFLWALARSLMFATVKTLDCVSSWPVPAVRWRGMRSRGGGEWGFSPYDLVLWSACNLIVSQAGPNQPQRGSFPVRPSITSRAASMGLSYLLAMG